MSNNSPREQWSSKLGFVLAAAGSAIGLGNIWKFPYVVGANGGAAFIVVYLICVALIGLPVIMAEILIGRTAQRNPVGAFKALTKSKFWPVVGGAGIFAGFLILSFYAVVAGWSAGYIYEAAAGNFYNFTNASAATEYFNSLTNNEFWIVGLLVLFMLLTMGIVYFGVQKGIERGTKIMMPLLFVILIIMMIKGISMEGSEGGITFLFQPDWSKINALVVLEALGQAFFTLSLGMGAMMTYGSYMSKQDNIPSSSVQIVFLDTLIALIAGIAIFTAVFALGMEPTEEVGLIFHVLPVVFTKMTGGYYFAILFFFLLSIAALTSTISLLEVVTAYFVDEKGWPRHKAVIVFGILIIILGIPSALSFNALADFKIFNQTFFGLASFISSNILLPLGGLLISVFVAYVWGFDKAVTELKHGTQKFFNNNLWVLTVWKISIKYLAPIFIFLVLLYSIGLVG